MNYFAIFRLIGLLVMLQGIAMLSPIFWALHFREDTLNALLMAAGITLISGAALFAAGTRRKQEVYRREALAVVGLCWIFAAAFGALPYTLTQSVPTYIDGFFEAMSGFTTTGSTILTDIEAAPQSILFWRSLTQWLGGMGIVVLFIAILPFLGAGGRHLYKSEVPGLIEEALTPKIKETAVILWKIYMAFTVILIILLMLSSREMNLFEAMCHTFTTLSTGGFSTKNASVGFFNSVAVEFVIVIFMFLAGVNFSLHFRVWRDRGNLRSYWSDPEWRVYLFILAGVTLIITLQMALTPPLEKGYGNFTQAFRHSLFQTVSLMTTTGFGTVNFNDWPAGSKALLVAIMFIGGCGGSTAGGLKVIRWLTLSKIAFHQIERVYQPRRVRRLKIGRMVIDDQLQIATLSFFFIAIALFSIATILVAFSGVDVVTSATAVVATLNNIGPGLERVGAIENFAFFKPWVKVLLAFLMAMGRLELFSLLVLFIPRFWRA